MVSGRRQSIVISCVIFETIKVSDPIVYYDATRVHIISYSGYKEKEKNEIYREFKERVHSLIRDDLPKAEIIAYDENVDDFQTMLKTILVILESERRDFPDADIYVNISAGSAEYIAAAAIASMMKPNITPFSVETDLYTVGYDKLKIAHYEGDTPVGLTKTIERICPIQKFEIVPPDRILVNALHLYYEGLSVKEGSALKMIQLLRDNGLWTRDESGDNKKKKDEIINSNKVYFQRNYKEKWIERGWIKKGKLTKRYELTEEGKIILDIFYTKS